MFIDALNKLLMILFFLSCLNTVRHIYYFIQSFIISTDENVVRYRLDKKSLFLLGVSISYILTVALKGINL